MKKGLFKATLAKRRCLTLVIALCLSFSLLPVSPAATANTAAAVPFSDVPNDAWYREDVMRAVDLGLVNGTSTTTFSPDKNITYFEVYKLAACLHQLSADGEVTLVSGDDQWYSTYIYYNYDNGILDASEGYENTTRLGELAVSRGEFINIFSKALPAEELRPINEVADGSIPDVSVNHLHKDAIYMFYRAGILKGTDSLGSCRPSDEISRAEVAAIMTRMVDEDARLRFSIKAGTVNSSTGSGIVDGGNDGSSSGSANATANGPQAQGIAWEAGQLLGVQFLEYSTDMQASFDKWNDGAFEILFPAERNPIQIEMDGDEIYYILPRYSDCNVTIIYYDDNTGKTVGEPVYLGTSRPVMLKCNLSDLHPNSRIVVEAGGKSATYEPRIDLADGDLIIPNPKQIADLGKLPVNPDIVVGLNKLPATPKDEIFYLGEWVYDGYEYSEYGIDYYLNIKVDGTMDYYVRWLDNDQPSAIYKGNFYRQGSLNYVVFDLELIGGYAFDEAVDGEKSFFGTFEVLPSGTSGTHITLKHVSGDELVYDGGTGPIEFVDAAIVG